jgi:ABC-type antimicrobial peptide transport system permease subunit
VALALGVGSVVALLLGRAVSGLLYGVNPADPLTFGVMSAFLLVVALLGCAVPAQRATTVDPLASLKAE